jgi:hypothetical protein
LGTDTAWDKGERIHIRLSKGNEHHGDFDGFGLFYLKNGINQDIGCDYDDGTNCWKQKSQITGDSRKIRVRRISDNVSIYIGDTLLHIFDDATTEDLYLTLNTGAFNEEKGSLLSYHVEISEIQANGIICAENSPTKTTLKYDDGTMEQGLVPWSDEIGSEVCVRFTPNCYPATLEDVQFFVSGTSGSAASTPFAVRIYDDDNGSYPGTLLNIDDITWSATKSNEWVSVDLSQQNIRIDEGDFFVSMYWLKAPGASGQNITQTIGIDTNAPIDERSYLKWGANDAWHKMSSTQKGDRDAMIRATYNEKNASINATTIVLTTASLSATITTGSDTVVYGTTGANSIILESGAYAELLNFPGNNTITIKADSSLFTVSRSGATVTFEGTGNTVLKIPATLEEQTIAFNDGSWTLVIDSGKVMLKDQAISLAPSAIK